MSEPSLIELSSDQATHERYDLFVCAAGFESRATAIAEKIGENARRSVAIGFDHNRCLSFDSNKQFFTKNHVQVVEDVSNARFSETLADALQATRHSSQSDNDEERHRLACDISCFDRFRLAEIVNAVGKCRDLQAPVVDFWYSIAQFSPPRPVAGRNEVAGPVHKAFAGRFADPSRPLALIAGLGYEMGKVVGAAEYLQATRVIAFFPESPIEEFAAEVTNANRLLLQDVAPSDFLRYPVADPVRTIAMLDSVLRGLSVDYNVVILPGGPKIFVLACLLAQRMHRNASVWRVSSGASIRPKNVEPSGFTVGLRWIPGDMSFRMT
ncbi:hypothetical protein [Burkholderia sp. KJ006]|uniref:hypothetical protein n=1 Tax=Burkholderia sp. KJ006 TaxID=416344 RepID=UPI0005A0E3BF|nr:hypothetical protein [Burkholderia sp. KJ006]